MTLPKVSFGDQDSESIDWRKKLGRNKKEDDEKDGEEDLTSEEKQELVELLGFDPDELDEESPDSKQLPPPPASSFTE